MLAAEETDMTTESSVADGEKRKKTNVKFVDDEPTLDSEPTSDARNSITLDPWELTAGHTARKSIFLSPWERIDKNTRKSICMEHRKSIAEKPRRMSIRKSIFLDPWEIIDEEDDELTWEGTIVVVTPASTVSSRMIY